MLMRHQLGDFCFAVYQNPTNFESILCGVRFISFNLSISHLISATEYLISVSWTGTKTHTHDAHQSPNQQFLY